MNPIDKTFEFSAKNSLYKILYNYFIENKLSLYEKKETEISRKLIRTFIFKNGVIVNSVKTYKDTYKVNDGDRIQIESKGVDFVCVLNKNYIEKDEVGKVESKEVSNPKLEIIPTAKPVKQILKQENINEFVISYLKSNLNCVSVEELKIIDAKQAVCHIICLLQIMGFDEIKNADLSYELIDYLKSKILISNIPKELLISKSNLSTSGNLIEILIQGKIEKENNLQLLNDNLLSGHYDKNLFKYLQDYKKVYSADTFQYLICPLLQNNISSQLAIENLLKLVNKSFSIEGIEPKYYHYEESKPTFVSYFENLQETDDYNRRLYHSVSEYLFKLLKENCETAIEKTAQIKVQPTNRKYNFSNLERAEQEIFLIISNNGEGLAKSVSISSLSNYFQFSPISVGILKPKEKLEISVIASLKYDDDFKPELDAKFTWEEVSGKQDTSSCIIEFQVQKSVFHWEELKKQNPYSFSIIESPDKLFGRNEILDELKSNILSENIESYKLWGQKRVGKSSIVKTLKAILEDFEKIIVIYRPLGGLRNTAAINTLNSLGRSLCSEIYEELDRKIKDSALRERLRTVDVPLFDGALLPLEDYIKQLRRIDSSLKFVFILDEFDRLNEEFFLPGNLGETLSLSIGKGLNENKFIGFILVGSENMHLLDRQGINYNSYRHKEVDTFHKQWEYKSFIQIVKGPVSPYLNFSDEAIDKIFYESNGNPYFANLICAEIFKIAYKFKDSEIDSHLVDKAVSLIIKSSNKDHFVHYWSDGITEESNIKKERKADIRKRILVSFSMASNPIENVYPIKSEIERLFKFPLESEYKIEKHEVANTATEFITRKIFTENLLSQIRILPHLFESWLCGIGRSLMIEGLSDLEALQREIDLERELALKPDEINRLIEKYHFKEKIIAHETFVKYFNQFGGATEQRRVFKLIDAIYFISKAEIFEFYRKESRNIFTKNDIIAKEKAKTIYREDIELYSFSKHHTENVIVGETFKKINRIHPLKLLRTIKEDSISWKKNGANEIIIIEPIIEKFADIQEELFLLLNEEIKNSQVSIRIITFVITTNAKADLITATSSFSNMKLVIFSEVEETKIKPFIQGTEIFENSDEANQALYEVRNHFKNTSKDVLLVLFEDYCPSKSCPVLWFKSHEFKPIFLNEHGKLEIINETDEGEKRRDALYFAAKEFSQKINQFMINYLQEKAKREGELDWFILKYIPRKTLDNVNRKWYDENQSDPRESYFDFIDYKDIIKNIKDTDLQKKFMLGEKDQLEWMTKCNMLRRDPAHPEKPCPSVEEIEYFEKIKNQILPRLF